MRKKFVRGNQGPFMNREFQKAIYTKTRLKNKYWRDPSRENELGVLENEQGRTRGEEGGSQNSGILSERFLLMCPDEAK